MKMRESNKGNNSNRKLMQDLESAIRDLKEIQKQRDKLVQDFKIEKTNYERKNQNGADSRG